MSTADGVRPVRAEDATQSVRVLAVDRRLYEDGATRVFVRLVARWQQTSARVVLYLLQRPAGAGVTPPVGVRPVYPTATRELRLRWALVLGFVRMLGHARRADVVIAGREIGFGLLLARIATRIVRRPFVVLVQSDPGAAMEQYESRRLHGLLRWSITSADQVVCVSPGLVPSVEYLGVRADRVSVALNGIDVDAVTTAARAGVPALAAGEGPLVVAVGRLTQQKGFDVLVEAHARVLAAGLPHRLVILGEGEERAALEALAADLGVAGSVHLPGFVDNPVAVMAAADLYCLPSRWEGSPSRWPRPWWSGRPPSRPTACPVRGTFWTGAVRGPRAGGRR
ncbi:glycosyltransferase [Cellulomonas sp. ATA003]|uniref:glycosyltransferase n=1 Tax=Cellulomonas sp. ATA003 TaxID=3073064 RepID=UPI0028739AC8|nr:glycosyltransferase [Cellulomonas sp. ATA003]WNB85424.1 glycosyltransferase [Cellulomonas sp. ATA003]